MEGLMGWGYWTVRDRMCPEGWLFFLDVQLEVQLLGVESSEDVLWDPCNII